MTDHHAHAANLRGIVALLCGQALFVGSDSVIKLAGGMMPATELMAVRGVMAVMLTGAVVAWTVDPRRWHLVLQPLVVARASIEAFLALLFVISLPHLPLGDITVIMQVTPLVVTVLSALLLKESVGWRRWMAVGLGFFGVVLVAQPSAQGINVYAVLSLIVATLVAVRDIITRYLDPNIPTMAITFTTTISVCILGFAGAAFEPWRPIAPYGLVLLAASAVLVSGANIFIIRAFRGVEISVVAPFRYSAVVWATLLGFLIWGDIPNALAVAGTLIVVASGIYTMHRETMKIRSRPAV